MKPQSDPWQLLSDAARKAPLTRPPDSWQLLASAARRAHTPESVEIPHGFTTRVLAQRRSDRRAEEFPGLLPLLHRALACSVLIAALAFAAAYQNGENPVADEVEMADSAITLQLAP